MELRQGQALYYSNKKTHCREFVIVIDVFPDTFSCRLLDGRVVCLSKNVIGERLFFPSNKLSSCRKPPRGYSEEDIERGIHYDTHPHFVSYAYESVEEGKQLGKQYYSSFFEDY